MPDPSPVRVPYRNDPAHVASVRRLDCVRLNQCLGVAARAGWQAFGCAGCPTYCRGKMDRHEAALLEALARRVAGYVPPKPGLVRGLGLRRTEKALALLAARGEWVGAREVARVLDLDSHEAAHALAGLVKKGKVEAKREGKINLYRVAS